jgi:DHA1 family inner membrane transport protein
VTAVAVEAPRTPWRAPAALIALTLGAFLYVTTETLPVGLLDPIARDLRVTDSRVGLLVTAYGLVVVVSSIPLTRLTRAVPRRLLVCGLLGLYVVSALASAAAPGYGGLVVARVFTALSQALFWSVVVPVAAGLFPVEVRGRVLAVVFGGGSLAAVAGVPLGTWVGQHLGWRWSFASLAAAGAVVLVALAATLPSADGTLDPGGRGSEPDPRRFWALIGVSVLFTTGTFTFFTYLSPYLTAVLVPAGLLSLVLLLRGLAGIAGVAVGGPLVDRRPRLAIVLPVAVQAVALLLLFRPTGAVAAVVLVALTGWAFAAFTTPLSTRILQVAPGSVDLAVAGISSAINVGITLGALLGSGLVAAGTVRGTALAGGLLTVAALALTRWDRPRPTARPDPGSSDRRRVRPAR